MPSEELGFGTFLFWVVLQLSELFCESSLVLAALPPVEGVFFGVELHLIRPCLVQWSEGIHVCFAKAFFVAYELTVSHMNWEGRVK